MRYAMIALLLLSSSARAGLYNLEEPPRDIPVFRLPIEVKLLRGAAAEPRGDLDPASPRALYQRQARMLEDLVADGTASTIQRSNLGACYIRLGMPDKARAILKASDQGHFLVQANLAMAHLAEENYREALVCQQRALELWPASFVSWPSGLNNFYRACDRALLTVIKAREAESRQTSAPPEGRPIDPIFPGFRLERLGPPEEGSDGYYRPGEMPLEVFDRLPLNAVSILAQLLVWWPHDLRLWWQTAEVLAAIGQVEVAAIMVDDFFKDPPSYRGLRRHCTVIRHAARAFKAIWPHAQRSTLITTGLLLSAPGWMPPGPGGAALLLAGANATPELASFWAKKDEERSALIDPGAAPPTEEPAPLPFNWRHIAVSFVFGAIFAALMGMQWWEWRRRAEAAPSATASSGP